MARILRPKVIGGSNKSKRKTPSGFVKVKKIQTKNSRKISTARGPIGGNTGDPSIKLAIQKGLKYEIKADSQGNQYAMVTLPDGSKMDSWVFFRKYGMRKPTPKPIRGDMKIKPSGPWDYEGYNKVYSPTTPSGWALKKPKPKRVFGMGKI